MAGLHMKVSAGLAALGLCASSAGAIPAATSYSVSPLVALSALGSDASRRALCNSASDRVGRASTQALPGTTCVLPVIDPRPMPLEKTSLSVPTPAYAASTISEEVRPALLTGFPAVLVALSLVSLLTSSDADLVPIGPY